MLAFRTKTILVLQKSTFLVSDERLIAVLAVLLLALLPVVVNIPLWLFRLSPPFYC